MLLTSPLHNNVWVCSIVTQRAFKSTKLHNGCRNYRNVAMADTHSLKIMSLTFNQAAALLLLEQVLALLSERNVSTFNTQIALKSQAFGALLCKTHVSCLRERLHGNSE